MNYDLTDEKAERVSALSEKELDCFKRTKEGTIERCLAVAEFCEDVEASILSVMVLLDAAKGGELSDDLKNAASALVTAAHVLGLKARQAAEEK